jgi:transposase-like protein
METFLLLIVLIEEVRQMQGGSKENNTRRWTPEDKTRIVMESLTDWLKRYREERRYRRRIKR